MQLGAPVQGSCRGSPPQVVAIPVQGGLQLQMMYPQLPAEFPACGLHQEPAPVSVIDCGL